MRRLYQGQSFKLLAALCAGVLVIAGCDVTRTDSEPEFQPAAYSFEVEFVLDDLPFVGTVAAATYDAPEFTADVVNDGAVLAYFRDLEDMWTAMPFTYGVEAEEQFAVDYTATLAFAYERSQLDIFLETSSEDESVHEAIRDSDLFAGSLPMKIVVIPGGRLALAGKKKHSYESVKTQFDID